MVESAIIEFYRADQVHLWLFVVAIVPSFIVWLFTFIWASAAIESEKRLVESLRSDMVHEKNLAKAEHAWGDVWKRDYENLQARIAQLLPDDEDDE